MLALLLPDNLPPPAAPSAPAAFPAAAGTPPAQPAEAAEAPSWLLEPRVLGALLRLLQGVEASLPDASLPQATGGAAAPGGSEAAEAEEAEEVEATAEEAEVLEGARAAWALLHHCISRLDGLRLSLQQVRIVSERVVSTPSEVSCS